MFAEGNFNVRQSAQILGAAQQHQLGFSGVNLETVCSEPDIKIATFYRSCKFFSHFDNKLIKYLDSLKLILLISM